MGDAEFAWRRAIGTSREDTQKK